MGTGIVTPSWGVGAGWRSGHGPRNRAVRIEAGLGERRTGLKEERWGGGGGGGRGIRNIRNTEILFNKAIAPFEGV